MSSESRRMNEWDIFGEAVKGHIEHYTIPQYGDFPEDALTSMSDEDCIKHVSRYASRYGKGKRGRREEIRDLLKIAHYAAVAWHKAIAKERKTVLIVLSSGEFVPGCEFDEFWLAECQCSGGLATMTVPKDTMTYFCALCGAKGHVLDVDTLQK